MKTSLQPTPLKTGGALGVIWLLLLAAVICGYLGFGCYLINEHRRLAWHEIIVLWLGDVITLFWLLRSTVLWFYAVRRLCPRWR